MTAGLKASLDKTEAIWIGSKVYSKERLLPGEKLKWNQSGKFKLLGINYDLFTVLAINFKQKIEKIRTLTLLNSWIYRDLTYMGKNTAIKSLAMPILIQSLTVLPNPSDKIINEIQSIFYSFL